MPNKTTPTDTATIAVSACPRCGTIGKSGKLSCCGRGGSWFKNCGGAGNTKLYHTWHEGIQACKERLQSKTVTGQQTDVAQQKVIHTSQGDGMSNYKAVMAATKTFTLMPVKTSAPTSHTESTVAPAYTPGNVPIATSTRMLITNTSINTSINTLSITSSTYTPASTPIATQGCITLLKMTVLINILFYIPSLF